jgi:hypothetical protein
MGFDRVTWTPGRERTAIERARSREVAKLRRRCDEHERDRAAARALEGSLLSLVALLGS